MFAFEQLTPFMRNVWIVGAGGTGARMVQPILQTLNQRGIPLNSYISIIDGDVVEDKNIKRQLFTNDDVGLSKSDVVVERYSDLYDYQAITSFNNFLSMRMFDGFTSPALKGLWDESFEIAMGLPHQTPFYTGVTRYVKKGFAVESDAPCESVDELASTLEAEHLEGLSRSPLAYLTAVFIAHMSTCKALKLPEDQWVPEAMSRSVNFLFATFGVRVGFGLSVVMASYALRTMLCLESSLENNGRLASIPSGSGKKTFFSTNSLNLAGKSIDGCLLPPLGFNKSSEVNMMRSIIDGYLEHVDITKGEYLDAWSGFVRTHLVSAPTEAGVPTTSVTWGNAVWVPVISMDTASANIIRSSGIWATPGAHIDPVLFPNTPAISSDDNRSAKHDVVSVTRILMHTTGFEKGVGTLAWVLNSLSASSGGDISLNEMSSDPLTFSVDIPLVLREFQNSGINVTRNMFNPVESTVTNGSGLAFRSSSNCMFRSWVTALGALDHQSTSMAVLEERMRVINNSLRGLSARINGLLTPDVIILAVDSSFARKDILAVAQMLTEDSLGSAVSSDKRILVVDPGNEDIFGQVTVRSLGRKVSLPTLRGVGDLVIDDLELFENALPERAFFEKNVMFNPWNPAGLLLQKEAEVVLSCANLDQTLAVNMLAASASVAMVQNTAFNIPTRLETSRFNLVAPVSSTGPDMSWLRGKLGQGGLEDTSVIYTASIPHAVDSNGTEVSCIAVAYRYNKEVHVDVHNAADMSVVSTTSEETLFSKYDQTVPSWVPMPVKKVIFNNLISVDPYPTTTMVGGWVHSLLMLHLPHITDVTSDAALRVLAKEMLFLGGVVCNRGFLFSTQETDFTYAGARPSEEVIRTAGEMSIPLGENLRIINTLAANTVTSMLAMSKRCGESNFLQGVTNRKNLHWILRTSVVRNMLDTMAGLMEIAKFGGLHLDGVTVEQGKSNAESLITEVQWAIGNILQEFPSHPVTTTVRTIMTAFPSTMEGMNSSGDGFLSNTLRTLNATYNSTKEDPLWRKLAITPYLKVYGVGLNFAGGSSMNVYSELPIIEGFSARLFNHVAELIPGVKSQMEDVPEPFLQWMGGSMIKDIVGVSTIGDKYCFSAGKGSMTISESRAAKRNHAGSPRVSQRLMSNMQALNEVSRVIGSHSVEETTRFLVEDVARSIPDWGALAILQYIGDHRVGLRTGDRYTSAGMANVIASASVGNVKQSALSALLEVLIKNAVDLGFSVTPIPSYKGEVYKGSFSASHWAGAVSSDERCLALVSRMPQLSLSVAQTELFPKTPKKDEVCEALKGILLLAKAIQ